MTTEPSWGPSPAERAALRSTATLLAQRAGEASALMTAGAAVMTRLGTTRRASVAEIVEEAALSNQAFYRHFPTKDDLVAAIVDEGARRLASHLRRRMAGLAPREAVAAWIAGVMAQATKPSVAAPTRAINWNSTTLASEARGDVARADALVRGLLREPLAELGVADPDREAHLIGTLVVQVMVEGLWSSPPPTAKDVAALTEFCLRRLPD